jgi:hypothetical protein
VQAVYITIVAVVGLNLWRLAAAKLVTSSNPTLAGIGRATGALVHFGS